MRAIKGYCFEYTVLFFTSELLIKTFITAIPYESVNLGLDASDLDCV